MCVVVLELGVDVVFFGVRGLVELLWMCVLLLLG